MKVLRSVRLILLPLLAALLSTALAAGLLLASPATHPHLGQVLALRTSLHTLASAHAPAKTFQDFGVPRDMRRGSDGRFIYSKKTLMHAGALRSHAAGAATQVDEAVQTFDAFNPPPAFSPAQSLTPTNLTPVWTADQTMLVFSSNRTAAGGVQTNGRFHIWAIPINGGTAVQLTDSSTASGENSNLPHGEFFPALSAGSQTLAFTSDANSANVQNLYVTSFTAASVAVSSLTSLTMHGTDSAGISLAGLGTIGRPIFSPGNPDQIIFAATSTSGTYSGHSHLYELYVTTGGFNPSLASLPAKITDGPADDTDPAYSQDGLAIAFSSTASHLAATGQAVSSSPNTSLIATSGAAATRSIYIIGGGGAFGFGAVENGGAPVTVAGTDDFSPAWSSTTRNTYTNPAGGQEYLAFARSGSEATPHDIYTLQVLQNSSAGVAQLLTEGSANAAVKLNTNDPSNLYDDIYPTWSPFTSIYSLAYSSNRTVTYTDPATGTASETAITVPHGGNLNAAGLTVGANYAGVLESQVLNLDPPSLLPYSGNEIIHVANSAGLATRTGITPGQAVTFTVRLSSREAGVDDSNVYLQIKDPDSKYQDAQGLEHKVFAKDAAYRSQTNAPAAALLDSGSSAMLMNGGGYPGYNQFPGASVASSTGTFYDQRGSIGGIDGLDGGQTNATASSNTLDTISVGRSGGGTNTYVPVDAQGNPVHNSAGKVAVLAGSDPNLFIPWGPEFECQVVNPQFGVSGSLDTATTDYRDPYYLAGVDDQQAFSGAGKVRPIVDSTTAPAEWLKLTRLPDAQQDGQGGLLYSVPWITPTSGSDYYLDVIAFDKAVAPSTYTAAQTLLGNTTGSNWRIYDNVWGFSTAATIGNNDILVVSDYALGQKFAATTFGGQQGLLNLVPKLYGAESYVTDVDINILPNAIYKTYLFPGANAANTLNYAPVVLNLNTPYDLATDYTQTAGTGFTLIPRNGLGVRSYFDSFIDDGGRKDGTSYVRSQQYSLWRILARGPVPDSVYKLYEPTIITQPAVADTSANITIAAGKVAVANRCIVWVSPFTGDVLAGAGTIADFATQTSLRNFVAAGGRLCVSGQDVASALTQNGAANNSAGGFVFDVLNAKLATSGAGTHLVKVTGSSGTDNRLTNIPSYDAHIAGNYPELDAGDDVSNVPPGQRSILLSNNYGGNDFEAQLYPKTANYSGNWRTDASLDQLGPYIQSFPDASSNSVVAQIDTVMPGIGAHTDANLAAFTNPIGTTGFFTNNPDAATSPGGTGLIYTESAFIGTGTTATGTGSKVVFATFGLEALSTEYYSQKFTTAPSPIVYVPRNQRQNILHNIVSYLRTGSITGTVRSTTGNGTAGSGVPGAVVYLQSAYQTAIPGRGTYSATSNSSGNFSIDGIEPGDYTLAAYGPGYLRTASNPGIVFIVEGDTTQQASLTLSQAPSGTITGTVTDSGKNPVAGATVSFNSSTGQTYTATTDASGSYTLASIPPGTYVGTASAANFSTATSASTTLASGVSVTVNFTLTPGPGSASGIVTDTSGVGISGATVYFTGNGLLTPTTATTITGGAYTVSSLAPGTYSVSASASGYGTSSPVSVTITSATTTPVPDITLSAAVNGTLGGLVTASGSSAALSGVTITIVNTANLQSVTTTTGTASSPAAPTGDGSSLNYSISLPQGTYTVTASENGAATASQTVTIPANGFARVDFTGALALQAMHTFPAGIQFVSAPYDYSSLGFNGLFGTLNVSRSNVAVWNPLTGAYALDPTAPADALRPGVGYWVYLKSALPVTQAGATLTGSVQVSLNPAWNQIGVPSTTGVPVNNLTFTASNGTTYNFSDATGSTNHLVSPLLYSYNGTAYQPVGAGATLQPWQAYWIRVYTPVTLNIPTGH